MEWTSEIKDIEFLPDDFDFTNSKIIGLNDRYNFLRVINEGSQGITMLFNGERTKDKVVFKHYKEDISESSTQYSREVENPSYKSYDIEKMFLEDLTFNARIGTAAYELYEEGRFNQDNIFLLDGKIISPHKLLELLSFYNKKDKMRNNPNSIAPIIIDYSHFVYDKKTKKRYFPNSEPNHLSSYALENIKRSDEFIPLLSYEKGDNLEELLRQNLSQKKREEITLSFLESMIILHSFGIIHRDLKPNEIIVTKSGKIKIVDFGISTRFVPSDRVAYFAQDLEFPVNKMKLKYEYTHSKNWIGSRLYSPPQISETVISNKDDIFSAGVICAILLSGEHPFIQGKSFNEINTAEEKRKYSQFLTESRNCKKKRMHLEKRYTKAIERNKDNQLYLQIAEMFNPNRDSRTNRMAQIGEKLNINYPFFPNFIDDQELFKDGLSNQRNLSHFREKILKRQKEENIYLTAMNYLEYLHNHKDLIRSLLTWDKE